MCKMNTYIIYKITNRINGKHYIGKTKYSLEHRWKRHLSRSRNGSKFRFHSAIRKYGEDNWEFSIIETHYTNDENLINEREKHFINVFESYNNGYNANSGGSGGWMLPRCSAEKQQRWLKIIAEKSQGYSNANWGGLTDEDLIDIGVKFIERYGYIPGHTKIVRFANSELFLKFPKYFSKNRFNGRYKNYSKLLEQKTGLIYNPHYRDEECKKILSQKASINSTIMWRKRREQNVKN